MLMKALIAAVVLILMSSVAMAWDIGEINYNATTKEMIIEYSFSPFEFLYSFFIGGGEYTKTITAELIKGNYTVIEAGYSSVKISVRGNISFDHPVNIYIYNFGEGYYITNVTEFLP